MATKHRSPLEARKKMMIKRRHLLRKERKERKKQKLYEEEERVEKKHQQLFQTLNLGDFVQIIDSTDLDSVPTKRLTTQIFGDFISVQDHLGIIQAKKNKDKTVIVMILKGPNLHSLKDLYSPEEFPSILLHYTLTQKLEDDAAQEMKEMYDSTFVATPIDETTVVTLYVVKQGQAFSSKLSTRRWSLYCIDDKNPDSRTLFHVTDCTVTKEQDQKEMESPYLSFIWADDMLNTVSLQPYKQSSLDKLSNISEILDIVSKTPRPLQAIPFVNKLFVGKPRRAIPLFHSETRKNKENRLLIMGNCTNKSGIIDLERFTEIYQKQPLYSEQLLQDLLFLEDRGTYMEEIYMFIHANRFLLLPFDLPDSLKKESSQIEFKKGDRVRILKELPKKKKDMVHRCTIYDRYSRKSF